ncbi:unnamed protein product, partial [Urochloa humidicola]
WTTSPARRRWGRSPSARPRRWAAPSRCACCSAAPRRACGTAWPRRCGTTRAPGSCSPPALTYEEWAHAARMLEREAAPRRGSDADLYDEELIRNRLRELRHRRQEGSLRDIVFCMRADLLRNLGNMCNPELHKGRLQVP